ncbi:MAG: TrmH family RNA methyltransferase [Cyanobacteriota bacterium]|nr:TrmH family RNA methyltransferase [Cyanobacteriota bacterium]
MNPERWHRPRQLALVLVEPAGPLNVGSVARLCANFSSPQLAISLRLVAPRCDHLGVEAQRMAVHAVAVLQQASLYPDLAAALADCAAVVATSGRGEGDPLPVVALQPAATWLLGQPTAPTNPLALVFGREDRGLSAAELLQAGCLLQLNTGPSYGSMNLSHAVAVVLHGLHQQLQEGVLPAQVAGAGPGPEALAERGQVEAMLADAESLLLEVGFLHPHTAAARMAKLRALLQRAGLADAEVALLRGMVRQCRWAAGRRAQTS